MPERSVFATEVRGKSLTEAENPRQLSCALTDYLLGVLVVALLVSPLSID